MVLFLLMATCSEAICPMTHSRLAAGTQTSWAANEILRQDRAHITGWYALSLCAPMHHPQPCMCSLTPSQVECQLMNGGSSVGPPG